MQVTTCSQTANFETYTLTCQEVILTNYKLISPHLTILNVPPNIAYFTEIKSANSLLETQLVQSDTILSRETYSIIEIVTTLYQKPAFISQFKSSENIYYNRESHYINSGLVATISDTFTTRYLEGKIIDQHIREDKNILWSIKINLTSKARTIPNTFVLDDGLIFNLNLVDFSDSFNLPIVLVSSDQEYGSNAQILQVRNATIDISEKSFTIGSNGGYSVTGQYPQYAPYYVNTQNIEVSAIESVAFNININDVFRGPVYSTNTVFALGVSSGNLNFGSVRVLKSTGKLLLNTPYFNTNSLLKNEYDATVNVINLFSNKNLFTLKTKVATFTTLPKSQYKNFQINDTSLLIPINTPFGFNDNNIDTLRGSYWAAFGYNGDSSLIPLNKYSYIKLLNNVVIPVGSYQLSSNQGLIGNSIKQVLTTKIENLFIFKSKCLGFSSDDYITQTNPKVTFIVSDGTQISDTFIGASCDPSVYDVSSQGFLLNSTFRTLITFAFPAEQELETVNLVIIKIDNNQNPINIRKIPLEKYGNTISYTLTKNIIFSSPSEGPSTYLVGFEIISKSRIISESDIYVAGLPFSSDGKPE